MMAMTTSNSINVKPARGLEFLETQIVNGAARQTTVSITCPTEGASIAYTMEAGKTPHWELYTKPFTVTQPGSLRTKACRLGFKDSEAQNLLLRTDLMIAIQRSISDAGLSRTAAAKKPGVTQPRLSDLYRHRIQRFSLDARIRARRERYRGR